MLIGFKRAHDGWSVVGSNWGFVETNVGSGGSGKVFRVGSSYGFCMVLVCFGWELVGVGMLRGNWLRFWKVGWFEAVLCFLFLSHSKLVSMV